MNATVPMMVMEYPIQSKGFSAMPCLLGLPTLRLQEKHFCSSTPKVTEQYGHFLVRSSQAIIMPPSRESLILPVSKDKTEAPKRNVQVR
jgi:hypothetical protein